MKQKLLKNLLSVIIIAITVYLVFFFKTDITRYRIFQELWNLGHIFLFLGITYIFYRKFFYKAKLSIGYEFIVIILGALVIGYCIEIVQTYTGRDKSNYDVVLDITGAAIAFILFSNSFSESKKKLQILFASLVFTITVASLFPMYINVIDAINQNIDFPILVANEHRSETTRFNINNAELDIVDNKIDNSYKKILRVIFKPAQYATISLESFNESWSAYNFLKFSIYNPLPTPSMVILRIHDQAHELNGFNYNDRFNIRLKLNSGWNKVTTRLSDVKQSPLNREMNMDKVTGLMFFKMNSRVTDTLFFSQIQLTK